MWGGTSTYGVGIPSCLLGGGRGICGNGLPSKTLKNFQKNFIFLRTRSNINVQ